MNVEAGVADAVHRLGIDAGLGVVERLRIEGDLVDGAARDLVDLDRAVEQPAFVKELHFERQLRGTPARGLRPEADCLVAVVIQMLQGAG